MGQQQDHSAESLPPPTGGSSHSRKRKRTTPSGSTVDPDAPRSKRRRIFDPSINAGPAGPLDSSPLSVAAPVPSLGSGGIDSAAAADGEVVDEEFEGRGELRPIFGVEEFGPDRMLPELELGELIHHLGITRPLLQIRNIVFLGETNSGKTYVIKRMRDWFLSHDDRFLIGAYTDESQPDQVVENTTHVTPFNVWDKEAKILYRLISSVGYGSTSDHATRNYQFVLNPVRMNGPSALTSHLSHIFLVLNKTEAQIVKRSTKFSVSLINDLVGSEVIGDPGRKLVSIIWNRMDGGVLPNDMRTPGSIADSVPLSMPTPENVLVFRDCHGVFPEVKEVSRRPSERKKKKIRVVAMRTCDRIWNIVSSDQMARPIPIVGIEKLHECLAVKTRELVETTEELKSFRRALRTRTRERNLLHQERDCLLLSRDEEKDTTITKHITAIGLLEAVGFMFGGVVGVCTGVPMSVSGAIFAAAGYFLGREMRWTREALLLPWERKEDS